MAETLGSLCDKLTILKLKEFHSDTPEKTVVLITQRVQICQEIDAYIFGAIKGDIPLDNLTCPSTKIYKKEGNEIQSISGDLGFIISELADINCKLWHDQEKIYEFEKVAPEEKDILVKRLARHNLQRNQCIDIINKQFKKAVTTHGK
jgi:hypothetical protein